MCFNMALIAIKAALIERFALTETNADGFLPESIAFHNLSGFSRPLWPLITQAEPKQLSTGRWGLVPHWVKDELQAMSIAAKTLNARCETLETKASYRHSVKSRRCLIPVSGFYEPHRHDGKSYPFYMTHRRQKIFTIAGLSAEWQGKTTFTVITTTANSMLSKVHNRKKRMPALLFDRSEQQAWLDTELNSQRMTALLAGRDHHDLTGWPVVSFYGRRRSDVAEAQRRHKYGVAAVDDLITENC